MSLWKVITAPLWITAFAVTDVVIPIGKGLTGAARSAWAQKKASVHGDSDWATHKTLKKRGYFNPGGIPICSMGKRVYAHPEDSVLLVAKKGMGKSQTFIAIGKALKDYERKPDLVFVDPKGELHAALSADLVAMGYDIGKIDLYKPDNGGKYDPLSFANPLDRYNFDRDVRALCELMVPDDVGSRQPHFAEFSRLLFREIVTAAMKHGGNTATIADCVSELMNKEKLDALIARLRLLNDPDIMSAITTFEKMYGKPEGNSMISTSLRKLEVWRLQAIKEVSNYGPSSNPLRPRGWTWDDVFDAPKPIAMFIRTGLGTGAGDFVRLVCGNAINTARRRWNEDGKPLRKGLWLIVDEARAMGYCNAVMDANNELRSARVSTLLCFLSMSDIERTYGQDAENLMSQSVNVVFGGSNDMAYYKYMSERLGPRTEYSEGESEQEGRTGRSRHEISVPLMRPDQLGRLPYEKCVVTVGGMNIMADKLFKAFDRNGKRWVEYF